MIRTLAIVGRPNVGKSTLFNRIAHTRKAIVLDTPGVTRDRNYARTEWYGHDLLVIDTGGFEPDGEEGMLPMMRRQAQLAVEEADVIIFVVDVRDGLTTTDEQVFAILRSTEQPVIVAVNKCDGPRLDDGASDFYALGTDALYPISAEHGRGTSDLIDAAVQGFPEPEPRQEEDDRGRTAIAVVGRPNAGKSTLINNLLGSERLITSEVAGTTRDSIDTELELPGEKGPRRYTLIDTVGMRRRKSISQTVEKFGVIKAMQTIERANVVILMVDATEKLADQDARIANIAVEHGKGLIIVLNKWDAVVKDSKTADQRIKELRRTRATLSFAPVLTLSALTGLRTYRVLDLADRVNANWRRRLATGPLNKWFETTLQRKPPPLYKRRAVKLYYATQARTAPPTFVVQSNMPTAGVPVSYLRFLEHQLRASFDFEGTPIRIRVRQRPSKYSKDKKG